MGEAESFGRCCLYSNPRAFPCKIIVVKQWDGLQMRRAVLSSRYVLQSSAGQNRESKGVIKTMLFLAPPKSSQAEISSVIKEAIVSSLIIATDFRRRSVQQLPHITHASPRKTCSCGDKLKPVYRSHRVCDLHEHLLEACTK